MEVIAAPALAALIDGDHAIAVELGEFASTCTMLIDALGPQPFGAPLAWRRAVVSGLDARDVAALAPFVRSRPDQLPTCVCALPHRTKAGVAALEDDLERIAGLPPERLVAELPPDGHWGGVARQPRRWLDSYVRAVRRAAAGLRDPWRAAAGTLDREAERVGAAAARGAVRELIAARMPPVLRLDAPAPPRAELLDRVSMVPLIAGPGAAHAWFIEGRLTHVAYPVPEAWGATRAQPPPAELEALLGVQRASIVRRLEHAMTAGCLAEALMVVPSAVSHHLSILERAGLVERERQGRRVIVRRTARGTDLLALYGR